MKTIRTLLPVLAVLVATACTTRPARPHFGTATLDTLIGTPAWGCRVDYRFATILNAPSSPALGAIEEANIDYFYQLEEFRGSVDDAVAESLRQIAEELRVPDSLCATAAWSPGEISVESEASIVDTLLCYSIYRSSYTGGAHGSYTDDYHTYSLVDGQELSATDLFGEERMEALAAQIRAKIHAQYRTTNDDELAAKGLFPEYIGVTDNFRITPQAVIFHFNPYEIGCYALGPIEVTIPTEEIEAL